MVQKEHYSGTGDFFPKKQYNSSHIVNFMSSINKKRCMSTLILPFLITIINLKQIPVKSVTHNMQKGQGNYFVNTLPIQPLTSQGQQMDTCHVSNHLL